MKNNKKKSKIKKEKLPIWVDINGNSFYSFADIDDGHLLNIIRYKNPANLLWPALGEDYADFYREAINRGFEDPLNTYVFLGEVKIISNICDKVVVVGRDR